MAFIDYDCARLPFWVSAWSRAEGALLQRKGTWRDHGIYETAPLLSFNPHSLIVCCSDVLHLQLSMDGIVSQSFEQWVLDLWKNISLMDWLQSVERLLSLVGSIPRRSSGFPLSRPPPEFCLIKSRRFTTCLSLEWHKLIWGLWRTSSHSFLEGSHLLYDSSFFFFFPAPPTSAQTPFDHSDAMSLSSNLLRLLLAFVYYLRDFTTPSLLEMLLWSSSLTVQVCVRVCVSYRAFHTMTNYNWPNRWPSGQKPLDA